MELVRFRYGENNINTGPLKEIPEICVDHFFGDDLNSSVFFLSHAHTDHLVGLETQKFMQRLKQPGIKLYCHPLTPLLLGSFERYLGGPKGIEDLVRTGKIVPLDVNSPITLKIPRLICTVEVTVTLLPAGHCPGSVMFLFETENLRILHTGDFRLELEDLRRMKSLHVVKGQPKAFTHVYVDTTFCSESATLFPNRKEVLQEALEQIRDWIAKSKQHIINISFSAKFAHEYVLLKLFEEFRQRIHVTPQRRDIYKHVPDLYNVTTLDNHTQFHLCGDKYCVQDGHALTLRLSSIWYTRSKIDDRCSITRAGNYLSVCYSMHSSLDEIAQTINYLKPKIVTPLVLPVKSDINEIQSALRSATSEPFKFEDYYSDRNDFNGMRTPAMACAEEKDPTDLTDEINEELVDEEEEFGNYKEMVFSDNEQDSPEPETKRPKVDYGGVTWNYQFSPSPNKFSQSSNSSESEGSQETVTSPTASTSTSTSKSLTSPPPREKNGGHEFAVPLPPPVPQMKDKEPFRRTLNFNGFENENETKTKIQENQVNNPSENSSNFNYCDATNVSINHENDAIVFRDHFEQTEDDDDITQDSQRF